MSNLDFNAIFGANNGENGGNSPVQKHSDKMVNYYMDLCAQKRVKAKTVALMTTQELRTAIDELRRMPNPASAEQINAIKDVIDQLIDMGSDRRPFPDAYLARLTGGREGTASQLLQTLYEERREQELIAPPSREQLVTLCTWYICPDIPFDEFGINKIVYLEDMKSWTYEDSRGTGVEVKPFRQLTANEFAAEITRVFKRTDAQSFINQFTPTYRAWRRTRITDEQFAKYRQLELYLNTVRVGEGVRANNNPSQYGDLSTAEYQEVAGAKTRNARVEYDSEGRYYQNVLTGNQLYDEAKKEYYMETKRIYIDHISFETISNKNLRMLSREEASIMIARLQDEINDTSLRGFQGQVYDDSQETLEFKHTRYETNGQRDNSYQSERGGTYTRQAKNVEAARELEMENLERSIVFCEARLGYRNDELRDLITETVLDGDNSKSDRALNELYNFFMMTLDMRNEETIQDSIAELGGICEISQVATHVHQQIKKDFAPQKQ